MMSGTMSVRMLWPYMRTLRDFEPELSALRAAGITSEMLADSDARVSRHLVGTILLNAAQRTSDAALGLHAGEHAEAADFGVVDQAVRACPDVRRALSCIARYTRLQDDNLEMHLLEEGDCAIWQIRNAMPSILRLTNDFQVTAAFSNLSRRLGLREAPLEVHFRHAEATDAAEYTRVFRARVRLGMTHNGIVLPRKLLDRPVPSANPQAFSLFDVMARRRLENLDRGNTTAERVRQLVVSRLGRDDIRIDRIGVLLHMSEATLRRRLEGEQTTYTAIVDGVRRELAARYVAEPRVALGEIAFLLGFATQSAFGRAYRRWNGVPPVVDRRRIKEALWAVPGFWKRFSS